MFVIYVAIGGKVEVPYLIFANGELFTPKNIATSKDTNNYSAIHSTQSNFSYHFLLSAYKNLFNTAMHS